MRFLLRLYPSAWRKRYGEEYEAVLADRNGGLRDGIDIVRGALDARLHGRSYGRRRGYREGDSMRLERDVLRDELRAVLAAREELGPEHELELVESFLDLLAGRDLSGQQGAAMAPRGHSSTLSRGVLWLSALLVLWIVAGVSSIAAGVPWSLGSTAPAQVFAASVVSGYALVLLALLIACCLALLASLTGRMMRRLHRVECRFQ